MTFSVEIPMPPSVNAMYRNVPGRGRAKTKAYKAWRSAAALTVVASVRADQRIGGPVDVVIELPAAMRGDADNRIKATLDCLVASGRIDDDRHVREVTARKVRDVPGALVHVKAASPRGRIMWDSEDA